MYNCAGWKRCGTIDEKYLIKPKIRSFLCKNKFAGEPAILKP
jgi:hypothetical protein